MPEVEWRTIPAYPKYEASSEGQIRRSDTNRIRKAVPNGPDGRLRMTMYKPGGIMRMESVHRMIASAFHPNPLNFPVVRHLDGNPLNNRADNLRWGTYSENSYDAIRHGTHFSPGRGKTHCIRGHEFTEENTRLNARGWRYCRACMRVRDARRKKDQ